jgi:type II secretory pathway component PulM
MAMRWPRALTRTWDAGRASQRAAWIGLALVATIVVALAVLAVPLRDAIARMRQDVAHHRAVLAVARARAAENLALSRAAAPMARPDPRAAIDRVFTERGLAYVRVDAEAPEGEVRIVMDTAPFDALVHALDTLARDEGIRVADATVTGRVEAGTVRAELALTR